MRSPPLLCFNGTRGYLSGLQALWPPHRFPSYHTDPPMSLLGWLSKKQPCRPFRTLPACTAQGSTLLSSFLWKPSLPQLAPAHEDSQSRSHVLGNVDSVRTRALPALRKSLCSAFHPGAHTDWLVGLAGRRCECQAEQRTQFLFTLLGPRKR